jgi:sugar (pentulose or hexulose) kinase
MKYAIAVIDIGMTNKKIVIYDDRLKPVDILYQSFPPKMEGGLEAHDLPALEEWFLQSLAALARVHPIRAIAVATHGATFVCTGPGGKPVLPCVYYTHEPGEKFHQRFYERFGPPKELQALTGSPPFKALINAAQGILFAAETFPGPFAATVHLLLYPQYWGFRFTGRTGIEGSSVGAHTYLWNQVENRPSAVAKGLGAAALMPEKLRAPWEILGPVSEDLVRRTGLCPETVVTLGIHDSNAALLPHFAKRGREGFLLNSTGTWCVSMKAVPRYGFLPGELGKTVFFNISAFGTPIKTAIFLGGQEFELWSKVLKVIHRREDLPPYDRECCRAILREKRLFLLPELNAGSGLFPRSRPRVHEDGRDYPFEEIASGQRVPPAFRDYERGIAVLRISLALQSLSALEQTGLDPGTAVITEGGFRKDDAYNALVAGGLGENRVYLTDIPEASALGAAMTARMALCGETLEELGQDLELHYEELPAARFPELPAYRETWLSLTGAP